MEEHQSKLEALRTHLAEGATQAKKSQFVKGYSIDKVIETLDGRR